MIPSSNRAFPGSGGASFAPLSLGGFGGGVIIISVSGTFEVDGIISANGGNGSGLAGGGGAGGSIRLTAGAIAGVGSITANGGNGADGLGGGGGGGMIAVPTVNNTISSFTGNITAYGGSGANPGGAGTIYLPEGSQRFQLVLDAGGNPGPITPVAVNSSSVDVTIRNGAKGSVGGSTTLGNVLISPNSSLVASNLNLNCATLTVQAGGSILGDALYSFGNATGGASGAPSYACGGGGNGGPGGNSVSNIAFGGVNQLYYQTSQGSPGGSEAPYSIGGLGGSMISVTSTGLMQIDGIISANGGNGSGSGGGGGAGGAVVLSCGSIGGIGTIRANGGAGVASVGGGGGGGDVSVTINNTVNQFTGLMSAYGGAGANWGGAGLITVKLSGQVPQVILDAGNNPLTPTPINTSTTESLTLRNGAIGIITLGGSVTFSNLLISPNSWLYVSNGTALASTLYCSSATIQAGGGISADSLGYAPGQGTGAGRSVSILPYYPCGGGAHGGAGGNSISNLATGGLPYDSQTAPRTSGSGGGTIFPDSLGGWGGGAFFLSATGLLQVDGVITANGGNGSGTGGGGGAGGGIQITAGTLAGIGTIRANGGSGVGTISGGGSGGIIAIYTTANSFTGSISAWGGSGAVAGGAGTIYSQSGTAVVNGQLLVDNNGQSGAFTPLQTLSSSISILLRNGAFAYQQGTSQTFASILIASNGWLTANTNVSQVNLFITGNATVEAGGGIIANGTGSPGGSGLGAGHTSTQSIFLPGGGGGYGGNGGNALSNSAAGGAAYGSITEPTAPGSGTGLGSGGGSIVPNSLGGSGGGAIRLSVTGTLDASGTISANGNNGSGLGGGGGSGGGIWLTASTLTGVGTITANGGNGAEGNGGGGGGGRISIGYNNSSSFVGTVAAHGGLGFANGGAGTIYTAASKQSAALVLADNGGLVGTNTPMGAGLGTPAGAFNLTVQNGAAVGPEVNFSFPELGNLTIASGGVLTGLPGSTFDVIVQNNADIQSGGAVIVDGEGYSEQNGPGAGRSSGLTGSGAGYGGPGGASSAIAGGPSYGSVTQPVDFGSGGGFGNQNGPGLGSAGGGALRLNVGGILTVDGEITSEGQAALGDSAGGGSGGSIWVTAGMLAGAGDVAADGGEGQLYYGGGGAGGRIALYSRTNVFGGATSAAGAAGYVAGGNGTIVISNNVAPLVVLSSTPTGTINNSVSSATIYFSGAPNPATLSGTSVSIVTPNGPLSGGLSVTMLNSSTYQVNFLQQTTPGNYALIVNQGVTDLYGRPLSQVYTQMFSVSLPVIQGTITDGVGNPLAGVTLQNSAGFTPATTDTNGNYTLGFLPGTSFTVTPALANYTFTPPSMSYAPIASVTGQNYTGMSTLAPALTTSVNGNSLVINWQAVAGVNYQIYASSNLINWVPCGASYSGSNGPAQCSMPIVATNGMQFFTVQPGN